MISAYIDIAWRSIRLDCAFLVADLPVKKWEFVWKKNIFLMLSPLFWKGSAHAYRVRIWNRYIYMENLKQIGMLQLTFLHHAYFHARHIPIQTVVDIGAHTGEFALFCEVLFRNKPTRVYHTAVSTSERMTMHIPKETSTASQFQVSPHDKSESVTGIRVDDVPDIQQIGLIDLLKIDVEGMEYDVLQACAKTLKKSRYILIEISIDGIATKPPLETLEYLHTLLPQLQIIHIGHAWRSTNTTDCVDILFSNRQSIEV